VFIGRRLGAIGLLWLGVLAFFWPLITPDEASRKYFGPGDFWLQFLPFHTFAARQLASGKLALWGPYMFSGHPFQADVQTAVLYPLALANEWLGGRAFGELALEWEAVIHFGLAATCTFLLVELLTGSIAAGLLAGVVFAFSGFLTSYPSQQLPVLESTVWLPLELYFIERAAESPLPPRRERARVREPTLWLACAGATTALAILAGHPQTVLYLAYLGAAYFLFRMPWRAWWRAIWVVLPAIGLAAAQLLPTLQLFRLNARGGLDYGFAAGGLMPGDLAALVLDQPSGGRILYVGILPLAVALAAMFLVRSRQVVFWAVTAAVALLLSLGTHGPLFRPFFDFLPGWNLFRDQERAVVWFALAAAVLAGCGLARLLKHLAAPWAVLVGAGVIAASYGNLLWANGGNNLSSDPPGLDAIASLLQPVQADRDVFRVRISQESLGHNTGNLFGVQFVSGDSPFELEAFKDWTEDQPAGNRVAEWQLLRLTNSHYVISSRELCAAPCGEADGLLLLGSQDVPANTRILESQRGASPRGRRLYLYRVLFPLPRAFFLTQAQPVTAEREAIEILNRPDFDPSQTLLLQGAPVTHSSPPDPNARMRTDVTGYAPGFVEVRTSSDRPAYLYLSEVAYPDWQASIDGAPAHLLLAAGLFNALDVSPGDHHVVVQYVPRPFYIGAVISAVTVLAMAIAVAYTLSRRNGRGRGRGNS
jgi:hypothetical protein